MINPIALSATHMECSSLQESVPVLTDLLAFEKLEEKPGEAKMQASQYRSAPVCARDGKGAGKTDAQSLGRQGGDGGGSRTRRTNI